MNKQSDSTPKSTRDDKTKPVTLSSIDNAPVDPKPVDFTEQQSEQIRKKYFEALERLSDLKLENDRLKGQNETEAAKAKLIEPYAQNVFCYLVWYSIISAVILLVSTFKPFPLFDIPDIVLAALVGSTAVSAIALVRYVVIGIFGISMSTK